ncbi:MAG: hypothetical protein HY431_01400 [Candidatus Levybacteria bacterium]|nr:hypothetical protein [Candidatus Levybacteria bacterium]
MSSGSEKKPVRIHPGWLIKPPTKLKETAPEILPEDPLELSITDISTGKTKKARVEFEGKSIEVIGVGVNILETLSGQTPMSELNARFGSYADAPSLPSIPTFRMRVKSLNDFHLWRIGIHIASDSSEINGEIKMLSLKRGLLPM